MHVSDEVAVDLDADGAVVGVEFLLPPVAITSYLRTELFERLAVIGEALVDLRAAVA